MGGYPELPELRGALFRRHFSFLFGKTHCKCALNGGVVGGVMQNTLHIALKFRFAPRRERFAGAAGEELFN